MKNVETEEQNISNKGYTMFKPDSKLKVGDILDVSLSVELLNVPEDIETIVFEDYKRQYHVDYTKQATKEFINYDFEVEAGFIHTSCGNIEDFIREDLPVTFEEIADYEIFDVDNSDGDNLSAKIRVKSLK